MRWSIVLTLSLVLSSPLQAREAPFVRWWNSYDEEIQVYYERHPYRIRTETAFDSLKEYRGGLTPPEGIGENRIGKSFVVSSRPEKTVLLVTPRNSMEDKLLLNEDFRQTIKQCSGDRSWLVVLPENVWTETDLNPYCTMSYDEGQIRIDVYWMQLSSRPFIDIVTGGLICTPHHLYGWDRTARGYALLSQKCTGTRHFESFTGSYGTYLPSGESGIRDRR